MLTDEIYTQNSKAQVLKNMEIIHQLLNKAYSSFKKGKHFKDKNIDRENMEDKSFLNPKAAVYLCWYSQLCDLVDHNPELADKLDICALPGRGFRGDWFIGIAEGSVSLNLGRKVIEILCSLTEEYKRFTRGIGLPTRSAFYTMKHENSPKPDFYLMPGSIVPLNKALSIHRQALVRSCIHTKYKDFRSVLYKICNRLATTDKLDLETIDNIIKRIPHQINLLMKD